MCSLQFSEPFSEVDEAELVAVIMELGEAEGTDCSSSGMHSATKAAKVGLLLGKGAQHQVIKW